MLRITLALFLLLPLPALAEDMRATVIEVHDGDTVRVRLGGECLPDLFRVLLVRLNGCDTPELRDQRPEVRAKAEEAREFTSAFLLPGDSVQIKDVALDKYGGRIVGRIEIDGADLCSLLIDEGLAREYHGRGGKPW